MKKNTILENIFVEKLVFGGKGFAKLSSQNPDLNGKTLFISGGVIPESIVNVKVLKSRKDYIETQLLEVIKKSPFEVPHPNNPYGMQAGIGWSNIPYEKQLEIKENQVREALFHIEKNHNPLPFSKIIPSPLVDKYRNKIEFSFGKFISQKLEKEEHFNVGFHKQGEFSKIEDFDGTILISDLANQIYKEIKDFAKNSSFPVYDQFHNKGFFRHIVLREAFFTNQIMIIFSINHEFIDPKTGKQIDLQFLRDFFQDLSGKYNQITSIYFSLNSGKADVAIGELEHIYGEKYIEEKLLGLTFNISPKSFFQTNSHGAEVLYQETLSQIIKNSDQKINTTLDLYGGTGTIGMIFAPYSQKVISVELVESASKDGAQNALKNNLSNIEFVNAKVEDFLKQYLSENKKADLLIIDPPRAGMHPDALPNILKFETKNIIYVSCNPSTLARDLDYIIKNSDYKIKNITPVDMFPHTNHIEVIVLLEK